MHFLALALLGLSALLPTHVAAQATLNKCIDTQGKITYSNLPCRNAREARQIEIDPAPVPDPARMQPTRTAPSKAASPKPAFPSSVAGPDETAKLRLNTQHTTGKPKARTSARQCDAITEKLGKVLDKMDQARSKGYTLEQVNAWNQEIKDLERKKQQSSCF